MTQNKKHIRIPYLAFAAFFALFAATSCVENSSKYKQLQAQIDSLKGNYGTQKNVLDEVFATLNEVEAGLKDVRQKEDILAVETSSYKEKIEQLKKDSQIKSVEFKKKLNSLQKELEEKSRAIESLQKQLQEKDLIISRKEQTIDSLGHHVSDLKEDITVLTGEKEELKDKVASQDRALFSAYYIIGSKNDLIEAGVISKGGLFKSAKVSYEAEKSSFIKIDYREISTINTNAAKAKVLSNHRKGTYTLEEVDGETIINISDPEGFWEQTKYLVIQTQ